MGLTVRGFLNRVRVSRATEFLLDPARSIADVALQVGFKDDRHFRRVFQKLTGETPSAYRRKML
jgi:transcriptional regulator GlxA family with amidase domain